MECHPAVLMPQYCEPRPRDMELNLRPDLQAKLAVLAAEQGCGTEALVEKVIERFVNCDAWLIALVEEGIAAADRGEFIDHEDVLKMVEQRYPDR